jgi:glycolate oxidase
MTKLAMPKIDRKLLSIKAEVIENLKKIVKGENVLDHEDQIRPFETDALSAYKQKPLAVVFPENTQEVSKILTYCNQKRIKIVPRGAGTGLSGGALPLMDSILLCLSKFNKIIEIDYKNRCVVVQPGVTNLSITQAVEEKGFYYAPDPVINPSKS